MGARLACPCRNTGYHTTMCNRPLVIAIGCAALSCGDAQGEQSPADAASPDVAQGDAAAVAARDATVDGGDALDNADAARPTDAALDGTARGDADARAPVPCVLTPSGPVVVTADGQVVEHLRITSLSGTALRVGGHKNVVLRNLDIRHQGGPGISVANADDIRIENVAIEHTGAPASGQNPSSSLNNIDCYLSQRPVVVNVRLTRGSSGIYLQQCPSSTLSHVEGHDFRGPFPRGQLVQWNASNDGTLEDFSVENGTSSWPEDNVNMYKSLNMTVRRGLVDGNSSPSGVGVIFDGDTSSGLVEDVDAIRMGNGCFSDIAGADGNVFRRTRCRDNLCTDQGRGKPGSNGLMWCGRSGATRIRLEAATYFAPCNPSNITWPNASFAVREATLADFVPRAPERVILCF